ncbi:hypothetical protein BCV69DRAFT_248115 [Microstroma glucosiphilum]|uniref:Transmembrane protein 135 N-terminal domain-containing protein n=1 Tax=Pseudomicrostroma glucosiphilum TaxID=1684307 RepID=A0A316UAT9_9BASI|nr:hypothetical protein BCV69DRAFT_248115 [Pseudomicrostroma glucosiphilum]PWN21591.1 hypothetical protein BCV69DRAFT_248115 [Pseudomicrostroma glucosiphilum]
MTSVPPAPTSRHQRRVRLARSVLDPAAKAYLIGYLVDLIPSILKAILRFVTHEIKRIRLLQKRVREEKRAARELIEGDNPIVVPESSTSTWEDIVLPSLRGMPSIAKDVGQAAGVALGPQGMAAACAAAMLGTAILDELLASIFIKSGPKAAKSSSSSYSQNRLAKIQHIRIWTCFVAAALSSGSSLMLVQRTSAAGPSGSSKRLEGTPRPGMLPSPSLNSLKKSIIARFSPNSTLDRPSGLPTPLAPGGHFLARLTSLSIPVTPANPGSLSPVLQPKALPNDPEKSLNAYDASSGLPSPATAANTAPAEKSRALGKPSPTVDLTLFALVRGLDTLIRAMPLFTGSAGEIVSNLPKGSTRILGNSRSREQLGNSLRTGGSALVSQAEGLTFVMCCAVIMWSWFYAPERLPPTYVKWITNLATMDERLLLALRGIRNGKPHVWGYGNPNVTPQGIDMLSSLAESLGLPYEWGDPTRLPHSSSDAQRLIKEAKAANAETLAQGREVARDPHRPGGDPVPGYVLSGAAGRRGKGKMGGMPCELVHCGVGGSSCFANAALRWLRGWKVCMGIYIPVHLLPRLLFNPRQFAKNPIDAIQKVLMGSARSASFLATFIASIWFMVCLGRTVLLPRLFPSVSHRFWDRGLGPLMGSFACGFAIFIEEKRKRAEMALYVAPRALYACAEMLRPGWLSNGQSGAVWAERIVFGLAGAIVVTAARFRPQSLRGITSVMAWVLKSNARELRVKAKAITS